MSLPAFSRAQVAANDGRNGAKAWIIVNGDVLDVTAFAGGHPGGEQALLEYAGKDATKVFYSLHRHEVLLKRLARLKIGTVEGFKAKDAPQLWQELSPVPYAEIDMSSPYYNDSHRRLRMVLRQWFVESGVLDWSEQAESTGELPSKELFQKCGSAGLLALFQGAGPHLARIPEPNLWSKAGIKPGDVDLFHITLCVEEHKRMMCPGAEDGLWTGVAVGLGPLLKFGPAWMKEDVAQSVLMGDKVICLAITEPYVGSDVAGVTTTAVKSADGSHYVVSGTKKWITNSVFADYFTTLVRLGKSKDLALLLIPRCEGVTVRPIPTDYSSSAGTGLVSFENVVVPAANLIGKEGEGMKLVMFNFNLERLTIVAGQMSRSRRVVEECFLWANQREVFGKRLVDQPVVRMHLAEMLSDYQAAYALYENIIAQYQRLPPAQVNQVMGGPIGLLKYRTTRMTSNVGDRAVQIMGGRGVTRTGMGKNISRFQKSLKMAAVYGGSEEIVADLGIRQMLKSFPQHARL